MENNLHKASCRTYLDSKAKDFPIRNGVDEGVESVNFTCGGICAKGTRVCNITLHARSVKTHDI